MWGTVAAGMLSRKSYETLRRGTSTGVTFRCAARAISLRQLFGTVTQHISDIRFQMVRYSGGYSKRDAQSVQEA